VDVRQQQFSAGRGEMDEFKKLGFRLGDVMARNRGGNTLKPTCGLTLTILFLISLLMAGCVTQTLPTTTPPLTQTSLPTPLLPPTPTSYITSVSTTTADQMFTNTTAEMYPDIEYLCPEERVVSWYSLELDPRFRIIIEDKDNPRGSLMMLGGTDTVPVPVPNTLPDTGYHYEFSGTSPDGKWFLFFKVVNDTFEATLWVSSFDGDQQWQLIPIDARNAVGWVSNEEIIVAGRPNNRANSTPILLINPFTLETISLPPIPESGVSLEWWHHGDVDYVIYYDGYYEFSPGENTQRFVIYNYNTGEAQIAFQWLNDETEFFRDQANLFYMFRLFETPDNMISMIMVRPYGFDIATNLDIATMIKENDYRGIMHPVFLPGEEADMRITWTARAKPLVAFDRIHYYQSEPRMTQFYTINYQTMGMVDYCYDRGLIHETFSSSADDKGHTSTISYASPDERYLAWNIYNLDNGDVEGASIIDLETGYVSYVDDIEVIGWGVVGR
jgi:hypothetical protein